MSAQQYASGVARVIVSGGGGEIRAPKARAILRGSGTITPSKILVKSLCLGEAKMAATTINVVNSFSTIISQAICFFSKRLYRKLGYKFINHNINQNKNIKSRENGVNRADKYNRRGLNLKAC